MSGNRIKNRKLLLVVLSLAFPLLGFAQATLSIGDFSIMQGETKEIFIELNNTVEIRALQVRLVLPDSLILVGRPQLVTERLGGGTDEFGEWMPSSKSLSYNRWDDGSHMILVNSDDGLPFSGSEGAVISFKVTASDNAPLGEYAVGLEDVELVYGDGENYVRQDDSSSKVTVVSKVYALIYQLDGVIYHIDSLEVGTVVAPLEIPEKEGHTFSGWSGVPDTMPAEDVTVTGTFDTNSYTVYVAVEGLEDMDVECEPISVLFGSEIPLPEITIEPDGAYMFQGWKNVPSTMPARDITIVAVFKANKYALMVVLDGEEFCTDSIICGYKYDKVIEFPEKKGHTLRVWSEEFSLIEMEEGGSLSISGVMPPRNITLTATYTVNKYKLTGVLLLNGLPLYTLSDSVSYGAVIPHPAVPSLPGYTFGGWDDVPDVMPAHDLTITASFTVNSYLLTYKVDGEVYYSDSVTYKSSITVLDAPVKEGHTFSGWSEIPETMPAKDVVVTGSFTANSYKLTYMVDGDVYSEQSVEYGTAIVTPGQPVKEGHTFSGWSEIPDSMPAHNVTVLGSFSVNTYLVTYIVDGEIHYTDSVSYGDDLIAIADPVKEGYTFSGWSEIPETMPAHNVTIIGLHVLNATQTDSQGVIYMLDEENNTFTVTGHTELLSVDVTIPATLYDVPVASVKARAFMGAVNMESITIPASVTAIGERVFYGCVNLLVVDWNATAPLRAACFDASDRHGNMLVFVNDAATEIAYEGNVIVGGMSEQITLSKELPFRNTREFTARRISYTHEFTKQTRIGESGGWEALVLPFDVQTVTSEEKGTLLPFGKADFATSLAYWVAELQSDGTFAYVDTIKANAPFIMEVPNSNEYEEMYNIKGNVTFSAENVVVRATTSMPEQSGSNYALIGCYEGVESGSRVYALNDEEYTADGIDYMPGGVFVSDGRDIRPFEAYVYSSQVTLAPYLRIGGKGSTGIGLSSLNTQCPTIYDLQGRKVLNTENLKGGIYIVNGQKVVIK